MSFRSVLFYAGLFVTVCISDRMTWGAAEMPPASKKTSLQEVIQIALSNHADVGIARQSVVSADAGRIAARSPLLPQATTTFNFLRGKSVGQQSGVNFRRVGDLNSEQGTFNLSWQLDSGGNYYRYRGSRYDQRSARAGLGNAANNTRLNATTAYLEALRAQRLLDLAKANQRVAEAQLEMVKARIKAGDAAPVDELPLLVQVRNAEVQVLSADNSVRTSASTLREAMGLDYGPPLDLEDLPEPKGLQVRPLKDYLEDALRSRPDLIGVQADILSSLSSYRATRAAALPSLTLNYGNLQGYGNFSSLSSQWSFQAFVSVPILNWGALRADARQVLTAVKSNQLSAGQLRKNIAAQVEQSHLSLTNAHDRITASHVEVEAALKNLEAQNFKYKLGAGVTVVDVIQAQVQLNQAQTNLIQAVYDSYLSLASLEWAVGRGTDVQNYLSAIDAGKPAPTRELSLRTAKKP